MFAIRRADQLSLRLPVFQFLPSFTTQRHQRRWAYTSNSCFFIPSFFVQLQDLTHTRLSVRHPGQFVTRSNSLFPSSSENFSLWTSGSLVSVLCLGIIVTKKSTQKKWWPTIARTEFEEIPQTLTYLFLFSATISRWECLERQVDEKKVRRASGLCSRSWLASALRIQGILTPRLFSPVTEPLFEPRSALPFPNKLVAKYVLYFTTLVFVVCAISALTRLRIAYFRCV